MSAPSVFSHVAMATRWHIRTADCEPAESAQACQEAFLQLDKLEGLLSRFIASSDISRINALRDGEKIGVQAETWRCLALAQQIAQVTERAFDPTAGALSDFWKQQSKNTVACQGGFCDEMPEWRTAFENFRFATLALHENLEVECITAGASLDLGGIGKGFALDLMAETLRYWGIESALLSAGGSTILALEAPKSSDAWKIGFADERPPIPLKNQAISSTGTQFQAIHLIDPRNGLPACGKSTVRVLAPNAAEADALSTAFYVMSEKEIAAFLKHHPEIRRLE